MVRRKSGHGIWIHGRGHALIPYETQGCVALSTSDIHRMDAELAEGMPVVIADEVRLGGPEAAKLRDEAREVVDATKAWGKAWENRSDAFFDFHDPEKFSLTEGKPFSSFRSHKEGLFRSLPWIKVDLSEIRAIPGPDYWVTYFVQLYRSPTLVSQGLKRLYWQRGADGRFRIIGMEYEEMPVTLAANGKRGKRPSPDEAETDTRRPDSPSEEEVQVRQLVDAQHDAMERVAQKAFASLSLKAQPSPEDQAILEVAGTGATKPGVSPFATDALRQAPPAPQDIPAVPPAAPAPIPAKPAAVAQKASAPAPEMEMAVAAPPAPAPAAPVQVAAVSPAKAAPVAAAAPAPEQKAPEAAPAPSISPAKAAEIAAAMEGWRAAWERGDITAYMGFYADGARQGNLRGKDAIKRQKEGVWRGVSPGRVGIEVVAAAPSGDGYAVVCAETYQAKGRRESKGYKNLLLVPSGNRLLITQERWTRDRPADISMVAAKVKPVPAPEAEKPAAPVTATAPATPATSATAQAEATKIAPAPAKADRTAQVASLVESWRTAWEKGNADAYAGFYSPDAVQGDRRGRASIRDDKVDLWKDKAPSRIALSDVKIRPRKDGFVVTCVQDYRSRDGGGDHGLKTLYLAPSGGGFAIVEEKWSRL